MQKSFFLGGDGKQKEKSKRKEIFFGVEDDKLMEMEGRLSQ